MREIKFRAWDKYSKIMNPVVKINFDAKEVVYYESEDYEDKVDFQSFDMCELMQFTGLKDKNGKEIYEGDIVDNEITPSGYVISREGCFMVKWENGYCFVSELKKELYGVIGNIYENPSLLKGEK